ncbi:metallo-peptidase family m12B reprolysin-like domain-containing protein [Ditylenchus destructor]|nr:metallo-peptidase family m12B reprolysin-like domain-containing protein [Ditylenchus destructor]
MAVFPWRAMVIVLNATDDTYGACDNSRRPPQLPDAPLANIVLMSTRKFLADNNNDFEKAENEFKILACHEVGHTFGMKHDQDMANDADFKSCVDGRYLMNADGEDFPEQVKLELSPCSLRSLKAHFERLTTNGKIKNCLQKDDSKISTSQNTEL